MNAIADIQPGVIEGMDIDAYHSSPGISKTGLDRINRSPARFYALSLDPNRPPEKELAGQLEGQLAHCAILEPDEFDKRYVTLPANAPDRPTEAMLKAKSPSESSIARQKWWAEWDRNNNGRIIITHQQRETALRQADAVRQLPDIREALAAGRPEVSAFWRDPATGVLCRCRPDWVHPAGQSGVVLLDVKTYSDASPAEFRRQCARKRYHVQDAFYSDGFELASGLEVLAFVFVAVETDYPFHASAVMLDLMSRQQGVEDARRNLDTYAECLRTGTWPGYSPGIETVSLPTWALTSY